MKKHFKLSQNQKMLLALIAIVLVSTESFAGGVTGITSGVIEIKKYIKPVTDLTMAIGGVVGIVGGIRIYQKWNSGDQDINKELMGWGGSCIFLIVAPIVVKGFFGV